LKISLQGLPLQHGRDNGGLQQLTQDMQHNFAQFGIVADCGVVTNADDLFSGLGYVVLERSTASTSTPLLVLQHNVDWSYHPIDYLADNDSTLSSSIDRVQVRATWKSMPPFCQYCHSPDHALVDCTLRQTSAVCHLCNETGHIARQCP
ncbi:MAG: hypothetical protein EXX96DRAFT_490592, partial [Benjaminiella poitrasii]